MQKQPFKPLQNQHRGGFANRSLSEGASIFSLESGAPLNRLYAANLLMRNEPLSFMSKKGAVGKAVLEALHEDRPNSLALYGEVIADAMGLLDNMPAFPLILGELEFALKDDDKGVRANAWDAITDLYGKRGALEANALDALL
ncbi:MAG: hypothetical protein WC759_04925, partial [Candidatus Micrarchaeia archaeon]